MRSFADAQLHFGKITAAGTFPNTINLVKADARRMRVFIAGGKGGTFTLKAGTDGSTFGTTIGSVTVGADEEGAIFIPESIGATPCLQLSATGTLAGAADAYIDTYMGI